MYIYNRADIGHTAKTINKLMSEKHLLTCCSTQMQGQMQATLKATSSLIPQLKSEFNVFKGLSGFM